MNKRFFAFGCSYTRYDYLTWADLIGANFDEHYNYGCSGASNTYIMNRVVEADKKFNFTDSDQVMVMLTGIGRVSYLHKDDPNNSATRWNTQGDLKPYYGHTKDPRAKYLLDHIWCEDGLVYQSWIASNVIKSTLVSKCIPHTILMGIDNSDFLNPSKDLSYKACKLVKEIYDIVDNKQSIDEWRLLNSDNYDSPFWIDINRNDGHPSTKAYLRYVSDHFPQFLTEKTMDLFNLGEKLFVHTSQVEQGSKFVNDFKFNSSKNPLF